MIASEARLLQQLSGNTRRREHLAHLLALVRHLFVSRGCTQTVQASPTPREHRYFRVLPKFDAVRALRHRVRHRITRLASLL